MTQKWDRGTIRGHTEGIIGCVGSVDNDSQQLHGQYQHNLMQICKIGFTRCLENDTAEELLKVDEAGPLDGRTQKEDSALKVRVWLRLGFG